MSDPQYKRDTGACVDQEDDGDIESPISSLPSPISISEDECDVSNIILT